MFVRFVLVLVLVFGCTVFNGYASGGRIASLVEPMVLAGMTGIFLCLVFLCGYGKSWRILFSSSKRLSTFSLSQLKEGEAALDFSARIVLYVSLFFALVGIMYYFLNLQNTGSLGPNLAVVLYSLFYLCFFQLVIFTMKGALRRRVILYMAEDSEERRTAKSEKESFGRILKPIVSFGLALLVVLTVTILVQRQERNNEVHPESLLNFVDVPSFISVFVPAILLLLTGGILGDFMQSLKNVFFGKNCSVAERNLSLNAICSFRLLVLFFGLEWTLCGVIICLRHLESRAALGETMLAALLPSFYAVVANVALIFLEAKVSKVRQTDD